MTKRKAIKVPVCVHQVPRVLCAQCPKPTKRKATVVPDSPRRGLDALVERVIKACEEAAQDQLPFVAVNARRHMRRAVTAAGRRAAKGET